MKELEDAQAEHKEKVKEALKIINEHLTEEDKKDLPAFLQIYVLGRPAKEEEKGMVEAFKTKGQDFLDACKTFNYE